jgi:hypothetical protein
MLLKNKYFIVTTFIALIISINQLGNYYLNFSILKNESSIKANLLRYFIPNYYKYQKNSNESFELKYYKNKINIRTWRISKNELNEIYYLCPEQEINAIGNYKFYLKQRNKEIKNIEVGMSVYPDNTSDITLTIFKGLEIKKINGKIKVNPFESIIERGDSLFNMFSVPTFIDKIENQKEYTEKLNSNLELKEILLKTINF